MPRERSQAATHCPHAYTRGSKPNIRYSKSIHTTAHPVSAARAHTIGWDTLLCASARRATALVCATAARYMRHTTGRRLAQTQRLRTRRAPNSKHKAHRQELRSDLSLTTQQARARTHTRHCATMSTASDSSSAAAGRPGSRVWSLRSEGRRAAPATWEGGDSR